MYTGTYTEEDRAPNSQKGQVVGVEVPGRGGVRDAGGFEGTHKTQIKQPAPATATLRQSLTPNPRCFDYNAFFTVRLRPTPT
jgi:hypothetical protein